MVSTLQSPDLRNLKYWHKWAHQVDSVLAQKCVKPSPCGTSVKKYHQAHTESHNTV